MNNVNNNSRVASNEPEQSPQARDTRITEIAETSLSTPGTPAASLVGRLEPANPLRDDATMEEIETHLAGWALSNIDLCTAGTEVKNKIIAFLQDPQEEGLDLGFIDMGTGLLPNIFNLDAFRRLRVLNASYCNLIGLPSTLFRLPALSHLHLQGNNFLSLPEEIGSLAASLEILGLSYCSDLVNVPDTIFSLSNECHVELWDSGLAPQRIAEMRRRMQELGSQSPEICFTYADANAYIAENAAEMPPIAASLQGIYQFAGKEYIALSSLPNVIVPETTLRSWLFRLGSLLYHQNNPTLAAYILDLVKCADENPEFQPQFSAIISEAATTCGDRIILSVLHLGIAHQLMTVDKTNLPALADFLKKGIWAIDLLGKCAEEKVLALRSLATNEDGVEDIEEIEIYLVYPIKLKERLNLPIVVEDMLFSTLSGVTEEELDQAYNSISEIISSPEGFHDFLIHHDVWLLALQASYQDEYESAINARDLAREDEAPNYEEIEKHYNKALITLTIRALAV